MSRRINIDKMHIDASRRSDQDGTTCVSVSLLCRKLLAKKFEPSETAALLALQFTNGAGVSIIPPPVHTSFHNADVQGAVNAPPPRVVLKLNVVEPSGKRQRIALEYSRLVVRFFLS